MVEKTQPATWVLKKIKDPLSEWSFGLSNHLGNVVRIFRLVSFVDRQWQEHCVRIAVQQGLCPLDRGPAPGGKGSQGRPPETAEVSTALWVGAAAITTVDLQGD